MAQAAKRTDTADGPQRRRVRNYLIDRRFQLKYAAYLMVIASLVSAVVGYYLWDTSNSLLDQSQQAVTEGQKVVGLGRDVVKESGKVNAVVEMNIVKDPLYSDNPELLAAFKDDSNKQQESLVAQQRTLENHASSLGERSRALAEQQRTMWLKLLAALSLLVLIVGAIGIVVTHRVAGPVYKMTRQLRRVADGDLSPPEPLRDGDELGSFHAAFDDLVRRLRERRQDELAVLDEALETLDGATPQQLHDLRAKLSKALE